MKHDSSIGKQVKAYFMHRKSGQDAYRFEREMEKDPFLYDAIAGMDDLLTSNLQQAFDELDDGLDRARMPSSQTLKAIAIGAGVLVAIVLLFFAFRSLKSSSSETEATERSATYTPRQHIPAVSVQPDIEERVKAPKPEPVAPLATETLAEVPSKEVPKASEHSAPIAATRKEPETPKTQTKKSEEQTKTTDVLPQPSAEVQKAVEPSGTLKKSDPPVSSEPSTVETKNTTESGMQAYQSYVRNNLRKTEGMPQGAVVLSFEVDKDGRPKKISVVNSLCTACDAEAIRLLQNGPAWPSSDKKSRATVEVPFR